MLAEGIKGGKVRQGDTGLTQATLSRKGQSPFNIRTDFF